MESKCDVELIATNLYFAEFEVEILIIKLYSSEVLKAHFPPGGGLQTRCGPARQHRYTGTLTCIGFGRPGPLKRCIPLKKIQIETTKSSRHNNISRNHHLHNSSTKAICLKDTRELGKSTQQVTALFVVY